MSGTVWLLQSSFAAGEISPSVAARTDLQKLQSSLLTGRNRLTLPHGPSACRPGFQFIKAAKNALKKAILVPFSYGTQQEYVLEFGEQYVRFFKDGGYIETTPGSGIPYEVTTPYLEADLYDLNFTQSADTLFISNNKYVPKLLVRYAHNNWTLSDFAFKNGPFTEENADTAKTIAASATTGTITLTANFNVFQSGHIGSLWKLNHRVAGQYISGTITSATTSSTVKGKGKWKVVTHGTWTGKLNLEKSEDGGTTWQVVRSYSSAADNNVIDSDTETDLAIFRLNMYSYTSGTCSYDLTMQPHYWEGVVKITAVASLTSATATVQSELAATAAQFRWSEGAWSGVNGYPGCSTFFQDRLVFGGTIKEPQKVWASCSGDYNNYLVESPVKDDNSVVLPLVSRKVNAVRALVALTELLAFTSGAEFKIGASSGGVLTPSNFLAQAQGYRGIGTVDPVTVGNRIVYLQYQGRILRDIGYDLNQDSYTGDDLTIMASHLFEGRQIVSMCYQQEPDSVIWCVRDDGILLALTYMREQQIWAWTWHETDGYFESVCSIGGTDRNEVWALVRRTVGGSTVRYVERLSSRTASVDVKVQTYLDSFLTYSGGATTTLSGLGHLEGKTVTALADGNTVRNLTVTAGAITLPVAASIVCVGLPYTIDMELPNADLTLKDGTVQGRLKKVNSVVLRLQNSRGGKVGQDFNLMDDIPYDSAANYGEPIPLFSGEKSMVIPGEFNTHGRICIRQTEPLPLTVLSVIREVTLGG